MNCKTFTKYHISGFKNYFGFIKSRPYFFLLFTFTNVIDLVTNGYNSPFDNIYHTFILMECFILFIYFIFYKKII